MGIRVNCDIEFKEFKQQKITSTYRSLEFTKGTFLSSKMFLEWNVIKYIKGDFNQFEIGAIIRSLRATPQREIQFVWQHFDGPSTSQVF